MKYRYLFGACAARTGDEMSGPALLLLGFAVTRAPGAGAALMSALTLAAAAGGPLFGAALDRNHHPERILAGSLAAYALGLVAVEAGAGRIPLPLLAVLAAVTGLAGPAVAGGWTSQLPRVVPAGELGRFSALDAMTFGAASLAGPALAAVAAAWCGAGPAVIVAAALVAVAVPGAWLLPPAPDAPETGEPREPVHRQIAAGFAVILSRPALRRVTAASVVSYVGIGMLLVCCPLLGQQRLGAASRGALLISAAAVTSLIANAVLARRASRGADTLVLGSTLLMGVSLALAAVAPGWLTLAAVALNGAGEGPQLTGLLAVRHAEAPPGLRAQVFTTAASLKIGGLAAGTALAGPLAAGSVTTCLLTAAGIQVAAAAAYVIGTRPGIGREAR